MPKRPNILMILTDHWRGDSLGCLDHPIAETPCLDSLAAEGVMFDNAYSPCPSCTPARRSLMTGLRPTRQGNVGYVDRRPWRYRHTLAGTLRDNGYQTINVGKTHFYPERLRLGFEELVLPDDYSQWLRQRYPDVAEVKFEHGVDSNSWMARPAWLPEEEMEESWFTSQAIERLEKRDPERPFFLTLSFNGPHPPWCPPKFLYDEFMARDLPAPRRGQWAAMYAERTTYPLNVNAAHGQVSEHRQRKATAAYYAYLAWIDLQIGRFVRYLKRAGVFNETLILFTSDHGEMLGDHNLWRKTFAYDSSARIPFVVRPPKSWRVKRNVISHALAGLEDVMPTFLNAAGIQVPDIVEGCDLGPVMRGEQDTVRAVYHHEHSPCYSADLAYQSLTTTEWKYIWNPINGREQLFHLAEDPNELVDCAPSPECQPVLAEWRSALAAHLQGRPEDFSDGKVLTPREVPVWREPGPDVFFPAEEA